MTGISASFFAERRPNPAGWFAGIARDKITKQQLQAKIADVKAQLADCRGTPCEVYSRVVGYLRPVKAWNKGKKEEYALRKTYCAQCR